MPVVFCVCLLFLARDRRASVESRDRESEAQDAQLEGTFGPIRFILPGVPIPVPPERFNLRAVRANRQTMFRICWLRIMSQWYQHTTQFKLIRIVEVQQPHGCASRRRDAFNVWPMQTKMVVPAVLSRMEQRGDFARLRINRGEIAALMSVAHPATQAEVVFDRLAFMFFGDNMVDLVGVEADGIGQQTVFAPFPSAIAHQATKWCGNIPHAWTFANALTFNRRIKFSTARISFNSASSSSVRGRV